MPVLDRPVVSFSSQTEWRGWLARHHTLSNGVWLRFYKKDSGVKTVAYAEALEEALCYGWIDSQVKKYDALSYVQKFTPRKPKSMWSKINRAKIERLMKEKRMKPAGIAEVERAQADGRWDRAYDSPKNITIPQDFKTALTQNKRAMDFFASLTKSQQYPFLWRVTTARKDETREKRIRDFVLALSQGKKLS